MIKELIGTAVKVETEQEARLVVALYESAGFEKACDFDQCADGTWGVWEFVVVNKKEIFMSGNSITFNTITIDQLAWDYGLAPYWADRVVRSKSGHSKFYFANDVKVKNINGAEYERVNYLGNWGGVLSTRPTKEPAGTEDGEFTHITQSGHKCKFKVDDPDVNGVVIVVNEAGEYMRCAKDGLIPIKTERDRVVDAALKALTIIVKRDTAYKICQDLYDIGALRMPEDE